MKQITYTILLLSSAGMMAGCTSIQDHFVDTEMRMRNSIVAHHAWAEWSWAYEELEHPHHFAKGFRAGYKDILSGGNGCQPTLPPRCYWKPHYQNPEGRAKVQAWFDGFSHGALAATQDGCENMQQIPISPTARMNFHAADSPRPAPNVPEWDGAMQPHPSTALPPVPSSQQVPNAPLNNPPQIPPADDAVPVRPYE